MPQGKRHSVRRHLRVEVRAYDATIRRFIPGYENVTVEYDEGTTKDVELPDGSHNTLKKLDREDLIAQAAGQLAGLAKHHSDTHVADTDSRLGCGRCGCLPLGGYIR